MILLLQCCIYQIESKPLGDVSSFASATYNSSSPRVPLLQLLNTDYDEFLSDSQLAQGG
jgi:hypothetical protein